MRNAKTIFLIAGEASGDSRGAELVRALKKENPSLSFVGLGGPQMKGAGVDIIFDLTSIAALGFGDVLHQYFKIRKIFYDALRHVHELKPAAIVFIDYPGFNLRFAKKINKRFPIFYYVSPQIWAWAGRRIHTIRRVVSHMIVLFQFEEELYRKAGVPVTWVGHPLIETSIASKSKGELRKEFGIKDVTVTVALLPGSRESEIKRILPIILASAELIQQQIQNVFFILSETTQVNKSVYDSIFAQFENRLKALRVENRMRDILEVSDAAIVASGTATLETAVSQIPLAIVYKTAWSTYEIGKRVIQLPYIGMPNVIAGKKIIREFIQHDAKPKLIAEEIVKILNESEYQGTLLTNLKEVRNKLGPTGASSRAAKIIHSLL